MPAKSFHREIVAAFILTRLGLLIIAGAALTWLPAQTGPEYRHISANPLIDMWHRWDAGFFTAIAVNGYGWQHGTPSGDATFMPLYPTLLRQLMRLFPLPTVTAATICGVLLSNVCLFLSLFLFDALLVREARSLHQRRWALWFFLLAPATSFFSGVYTESLYFLLSLLALYYAQRRNWGITGLAGFLAGLTRVTGWTLAVLLLWEAWTQRRWRAVPGALTPLLALPFYAAVVGNALGAWDALFRVTANVWYQGFGPPLRALGIFFGYPFKALWWQLPWMELAFAVGGLGLAGAAWRQRPGYGMYTALNVLFPLASGTLISMPRYLAIAFPLYGVLAMWAASRRHSGYILLILSATLAACFFARFVNWWWVA